MAIEPMKAKLVCLEDSSLSWDFKYNPKEFSLKRSGGFSARNDKGDGPWGGIKYDCAKPDELSFEIVLDVTEPDLGLAGNLALLAPISSLAALAGMLDTTSVLEDISALHKLTIPRQHTKHEDTRRPPYVAFLWGDFQFFGGISSIDSKVILFDFGGIPKRAEVSISMIGQAMHAPADEYELAGGYGLSGETFSGYKFKDLSSFSTSDAESTDLRLGLLGSPAEVL